MFSCGEVPEELAAHDAACKALLEQLLERYSGECTSIRLPRDQPLYADPAHERQLFVVREGNIELRWEQHGCCFFDEGDLVGYEQHLGQAGGTLSSEFAVVMDSLPADTFLAAVYADPQLSALWGRYLAHRSAIWMSMFAHNVPNLARPEPDLRNYEPGAMIVEQGTSADDVLTLVQGHAEVQVDGVVVGEVLKNEIFGAQAALSGRPRSASVVATTRCMVMALPKESFCALMASRPNTVLQLVQAMARSTAALNDRFVNLSQPEPAPKVTLR